MLQFRFGHPSSFRMTNAAVVLRTATETDVPAILSLIQALAEYERMRDDCVATEAKLRATLFGPSPKAEVLLAESSAGEVASLLPTVAAVSEMAGVQLASVSSFGLKVVK